MGKEVEKTFEINLYFNVSSSFICNSQTLETTQMPFNNKHVKTNNNKCYHRFTNIYRPHVLLINKKKMN
jgi:hypothetical protein